MVLHFHQSSLKVSSPTMAPSTWFFNLTTRILNPRTTRNNLKGCFPKLRSTRTRKTQGSGKVLFSVVFFREDQSSVPIKKSAKPQQAPSEREHQQDSTDPVFYREVDMSDLPSQYAEEVETFRQIIDLPDPRETLPRSSTTVLGLDDEKGQQELRHRGPSAMLPLNPILKDAFEKFEQDFLASNLPEGKYIKPPASTAKYYKVGQPCFEDKLQELNTDFAKICIFPKPSGAPMGKVPLQVLKELEHQARQNLSTINFTAFAKTASSCNTVMGKCQHSIKTTFKRVKSQIQKGTDPERAARCGYGNPCDYFEIMHKRILIQQRALACLSKSVAHILQRELYTMGSSGLLRREAEMTLLPHLEDSRCQELRNSPFWPTPLFRSQKTMEKTSSSTAIRKEAKEEIEQQRLQRSFSTLFKGTRAWNPPPPQ